MSHYLHGIDVVGAVAPRAMTAHPVIAPTPPAVAPRSSTPPSLVFAPPPAATSRSSTPPPAIPPSTIRQVFSDLGIPATKPVLPPTGAAPVPTNRQGFNAPASKAAATAAAAAGAKKAAASSAEGAAVKAAATTAVNHALATSKKLPAKYSSAAKKLSSASAALKKKATTIKGDDFVGAVVAIGAAISDAQAAVFEALWQEVKAQTATTDALAQIGDIIAQLAPLVTQLQVVNPPLAQQGQAIVDACNSAVMAGDSSQLSSLQTQASAWQSQAQAALGQPQQNTKNPMAQYPGAPWMPITYYTAGSSVSNVGNLYSAMTSGTSGQMSGPMSMGGVSVDGTIQWMYAGVDPNANPYGSDPYGASGGGGGDFGGGGGDDGGGDGSDPGDPGNIDWGDGSQPSDGGGDPGYGATDDGSSSDDGSSDDGSTDDGSGDGSDGGYVSEDTLNQEMDQAEGADGGQQVVGDDSRQWTNRASYMPGDVVQYWGRAWCAVRAVSPPLFPLLESGEVPGDSDSWRPVVDLQQSVMGHGGGGHGGHGRGGGGRGFGGFGFPVYLDDDDLDVDDLVALPDGRLAEVLGMFDMNQVQQELNGFQPCTVDVARTLVTSGLAVIGQAIAKATPDVSAFPSGFQAAAAAEGTLPGGTERKDVQAHLQWHADNLKKFSDKNAFYPNEADLKKYVEMSFVDANSVFEGNQYLQDAWNSMKLEIITKLASIPKAALAVATKAAADAVQNVTGLPLWAWILIGGAGAAAVGVLGYKVITSAGGGAFAGALVGGRR